MADITDYFSGPPLDLKSLPMGLSDEQKKKLAAAAQRPTETAQLPTAKPTNGPLPTVASIKAGATAGVPDIVQRGVDIRPTEPGSLVATNAKPILTRKVVPGETVPAGASSLDNLDKKRQIYTDFAKAFR